MSTAAGWLVVLFCAVVVGTALGGAASTWRTSSPTQRTHRSA
ncbi:MAG: hypothetical protein WKH64_10745 [Chloroflexia bacterium]